MSTTSDTDAIDEKKGEETESNDNFGKDIGKVMIYGSIVFLFLIMAVIIYFLFNVSKNPGQTVGTIAKYAI